MELKIGDKVSFSKSLAKNNKIPFDATAITDEQQQLYEDNGSFQVDRYIAKEHSLKEGFVAGKRNICTKFNMTCSDDYDDLLVPCGKQIYEEIYLVAINMNGFHKVKKEWIEKL